MQYTNFNQILCTGEWSESGQCMIRGGFFFFSFLHQSFPGTGNTYTYFLLTFLKYSRSLLYSDSTTAQKISWNGWPDLQVTDIIIIVIIYNSRQMWRGPYRYIYDQRRYRVSFYLAATMRLSRAGPGSDFRHEWHKLKHQVPPRGGHSEKKKKQQPSMFIIICQCTKNGKAVSEGGKKHWGSGCSYCDANVAAAQAHDFTWKQTKQQNGGFRTRCLILIEREPKTTDHFTASAHREPEGFKLQPGW